MRKRWEGRQRGAYQRRGGRPRVTGAGDKGLSHRPPIRAVWGVWAVVFVTAVVVVHGEAWSDGLDGSARSGPVVTLSALVLVVDVHLDHLLSVPLIALPVGIRVVPVSAHCDETRTQVVCVPPEALCVLTSDWKSLIFVEVVGGVCQTELMADDGQRSSEQSQKRRERRQRKNECGEASSQSKVNRNPVTQT